MNAYDRPLGRSRCHVVAVESSESSPRRGQALIEFAIVAFVLTLLLGGMLAYGLLLVSANVLQQAADVGAQELARHPFSATGSFDAALDNSGLFSEADLIVATTTDPTSLPLINQLLYPLYVFDPDLDKLRYPGAVVTNPAGDPTVLIPLVATDASGVESIDEWRHVVEEIVPVDPSAMPPIDRDSPGPYSLDPTVGNPGQLPSRGFVALRINYPYQSAALISYVRVDASGSVRPSTEVISTDVTNIAVTAIDSIADGTLPTGYFLNPPTEDTAFGASITRGRFGLGELQNGLATPPQGVTERVVRPFRKVLSAQGIYRRVVLLP